MTKYEYEQYLKTPHWRKTRAAALERAGHKCALGDGYPHTRNLEVHHRSYIRLGRELPEDLIVLCSHCHSKHHGTFDECAERQLTLPIAS